MNSATINCKRDRNNMEKRPCILKKPPQNERRKRQRYTKNACNHCKKRKVKCTGEHTCQQCQEHGFTCAYGSSSSLEVFRSLPKSRGLKGRKYNSQNSIDQQFEPSKSFHDDREFADNQGDALVLEASQQFNNYANPVPIGAAMGPISLSTLQDKPFSIHELDNEFFPLPLYTPDSATSPQTLIPSSINSYCPEINHLQFLPAPLPLSKIQAFDLLEYFQDEAATLYSFVPYKTLSTFATLLFETSVSIPDFNSDNHTEDWEDIYDSRTFDLLKLTLSCAVASKRNKENEFSKKTTRTIFGKLSCKINDSDFDLKDVAIAALLSVYYFLCDETILAWRRIGNAAKMCQELGLHKSDKKHSLWASTLFWSVFVLDRRFSFMANLPFTIRDEDIDSKVPEPDISAPYLASLTKYFRLAAKIVPPLPKFGGVLQLIDNSTCVSLDIQIDQWALATTSNFSSQYNRIRDSLYLRHPVLPIIQEGFVTICTNQLKIGLYKHNLFSPENIARCPDLSHKAVSYAIDTVQLCRRLRSTTDIYESLAAHYNFHLLSAIAVLYLAIKHAPTQFSNTAADVFSGLELLEMCCKTGKGSDRLLQRVQALNQAMRNLATSSESN